MRKCLRCKSDMIEGLEMMVSNGAYGLDVREKGLFKENLGKVKCAVCGSCGYVETYLEKTEKIKSLVNKNGE